MLLILMYHQIANPLLPFGKTEFKTHLRYLKDNFPLKTPGMPLEANTLNVCLTFDDAYFDFYHTVFPLLQQLNISVVLGIPTDFIQDKTTASTVKRLAISYPHGLTSKDDVNSPLCSWQEIQEMVASGYVIPASHSAQHTNLAIANPTINSTLGMINNSAPSIQPDQNASLNFEYSAHFLEHELLASKQTLEQKLNVSIDTFIFPYGKMSPCAYERAKAYYKFVMRIGGAINLDWHSRNGLLYRIDADKFWPTNLPISRWFIQQARLKYWLNRMRNK